MRFYHRITLALAIICLFGDSGHGAPAKGRYMWLKCNPDDKNANCVTQKGPWVPLSGQSTRLPPSAAKHIVPVEEVTPETEEQSGEGSGNSDTLAPFLNMDRQLMADGPEQELNNNEVEASTWMESSGDIDYANYVSPQKIDWLSSQDLKEDNIMV
ncbi:serglycin [Pimephales promelas]|uniref:serglycin n=1 Tax=Pimephales promelas TaxID=90988 RepID=UPI001955D594|nr:serglycin [Pimephales promelas]KAG1950939.1 serglycin [Pimephales promelas]